MKPGIMILFVVAFMAISCTRKLTLSGAALDKSTTAETPDTPESPPTPILGSGRTLFNYETGFVGCEPYSDDPNVPPPTPPLKIQCSAEMPSPNGGPGIVVDGFEPNIIGYQWQPLAVILGGVSMIDSQMQISSDGISVIYTLPPNPLQLIEQTSATLLVTRDDLTERIVQTAVFDVVQVSE